MLIRVCQLPFVFVSVVAQASVFPWFRSLPEGSVPIRCAWGCIYCSHVADLREQFASVFQERQTMQQFMWQPDMLQVAKFLDAGMKRMQEIDPDAGSNF